MAPYGRGRVILKGADTAMSVDPLHHHRHPGSRDHQEGDRGEARLQG